MSVNERERHELHLRLDEVLGPEPAGTIMSYLPPVGWADVATKQDLHSLENALRAELHGQIGGLHGEIGGLRGEMGELRGEMGELRGELHDAIRRATFQMMGAMFTLATLTWAATSLG